MGEHPCDILKVWARRVNEILQYPDDPRYQRLFPSIHCFVGLVYPKRKAVYIWRAARVRFCEVENIDEELRQVRL